MTFLCGLLLIACGDKPQPPENGGTRHTTQSSEAESSEQDAASDAVRSVSFTTHARACGSNEGPATFVVRDASDLEGLPLQVEPVDFSQEMLVGVSMGSVNTGGHAITIVSIQEQAGVLEVISQSRHPGPDDMVTQVINSPCHVVRTAQSTAEVVFKAAE